MTLETVTELLAWLESTPLALYIAESTVAFPALEIIHVVAIALVFGTIAIVDFRLLGLGSNNRDVTELCRDVLPWTWAAFGVAAVTGTLMFIHHAHEYFANTAFRMKMLLMLAAAINMIVFELITFRGVAKWNRDVPVVPAGKVAGAVSLVCWLGVVGFARWVGFTVGVPE
jgi:uncharacterized protein DUF6644